MQRLPLAALASALVAWIIVQTYFVNRGLLCLSLRTDHFASWNTSTIPKSIFFSTREGQTTPAITSWQALNPAYGIHVYSDADINTFGKSLLPLDHLLFLKT